MRNAGKALAILALISLVGVISYLRSDKHKAAVSEERNRLVLLEDALKVREKAVEAARVMEEATDSWGYWCRGVAANLPEARPKSEKEMRDALVKLEEAYKFINDGNRIRAISDAKMQMDTASAYCEFLNPIRDCQDSIKSALAYCAKAGLNAPHGIEVQDHSRDNNEIFLWRAEAGLWKGLNRFNPYLNSLQHPVKRGKD